jgi:hypothetical protein
MSRNSRHSNAVTKPSTMSAVLARLFDETTDTGRRSHLYKPIVHQDTKHTNTTVSASDIATASTMSVGSVPMSQPFLHVATAAWKRRTNAQRAWKRADWCRSRGNHECTLGKVV